MTTCGAVETLMRMHAAEQAADDGSYRGTAGRAAATMP
jgi:hypothetical protein